MPLTIPVDDPIIATVGSLDTHVPPPVAVSVVLAPLQREVAPEIGEGVVLILTVADA